MNARQSELLASWQRTEALLKASPETGSIAGLPAALTDLNERNREIYDLAHIQAITSKGKTARRDALSRAMVIAALALAHQVGACAEARGLSETAQLVGITPGRFARRRISHRPLLARQVLEAAEAVLPQLADYGVTAETLADLRTKIDAAAAGMTEPRSMIHERRAATVRLRALIKETSALLERRIDRLVATVELSEPAFFARYRASRVVVSPPTRSLDVTTAAVTSQSAAANPPPEAVKVAA